MSAVEDPEAPRPGRYSLRSDWRPRIAHLLRRQGFDTAIGFLGAHPRRSLADLAGSLYAGDLAVHLEWAAIDEATAAGHAAIEWLARDLLARRLHEHMPHGWRKNDDLAIYGAFGAWSSTLGNRGVHADEDFAIMDALAAAAPPGWLPADPDDPLLTAAFRKHWRREDPPKP